MTTCKTLEVTGTKSCKFNLRIARRLIFVPKYDSSGAVNKFASVAAVTKAAIQAKLDESDPLDRFYALPLMENVEDVRAEAEFQEYNSGRKSMIRKGVRSFSALLPDGDPQYLGRIESWLNQDFGCYYIDASGNFVYNYDADGNVLPIPMDGASINSDLMKATDTEDGAVTMVFDFADTAADSLLRLIELEDLDFDGRSSDLYGLLPLVPTIQTGAIGTTTVADVATDYGTAVAGLVFGDFALYDVTAAGDLGVTAAVESASVPGRYTLTHTTTVATNTNRLTVAKTKYQTGTVEFIAV